MLLNADIVFDLLSETFPVTMKGPKAQTLHLARPRFLDGTATALADNQLYVATGAQLPRYPSMGRHVVLVLAGATPERAWYEERCCVIYLEEAGGFFELANACQEIYDRLDAWDAQLVRARSGSTPIQDMVAHSQPLFGNDIAVIDRELRFVARAGAGGTGGGAGGGSGGTDSAADGTDGADAISDASGELLDMSTLAPYVSEPSLLHMRGSTTLSANLLVDQVFYGSVFVIFTNRPYRPSDTHLLKHLTEYLEEAMRDGSRAAQDARDIKKRIYEGILDQRPLDMNEHAIIEGEPVRQRLCLCLGVSNPERRMPEAYLLARVDSALGHGITFSYQEHHIVSVVDFASLELAENAAPTAWREEVERRLEPVVDSLGLVCGISDSFADLFQLRVRFVQARNAFNLGRVFHPERAIHHFQDTALDDMVRHAFDDLPVEMYFSDGLRHLSEHDATSTTSYIDTLRCYLNLSMNVTKTARALSIHRSTLMERLDRIEGLLGESLDDPDTRLRIELILHALQQGSHVERNRAS